MKTLALVINIALFSLGAAAQTAAPSLSIHDFVQKQQAEAVARSQVLYAQWTEFISGRSPAPETSNLDSYVAREATQDFLIRTGGMKAALAQASKQNTYAFTLTRPTDEASRKAGFDRARKSIFMDIKKMDANEWLLIFVHEVAHSLDSELVAAMPVFNDELKMRKYALWGDSGRTLETLSKEERKEFDEWLYAGLNRGFLAEYRAWLLTFEVYEEGRRDGTFKPVDWLEQLASQIPADARVSDFILRYLSPSWVDPTNGIFKHPFAQQALKQMRVEIDAHPEGVRLGKIGEILSQKP